MPMATELVCVLEAEMQEFIRKFGISIGEDSGHSFDDAPVCGSAGLVALHRGLEGLPGDFK
jgi:hypothetical protein